VRRKVQSISIDPEVVAKIAVVAQAEGRSMSNKLEALAREAIRAYESAHGPIKIETREEK
jgi:hypothetical protein